MTQREQDIIDSFINKLINEDEPGQNWLYDSENGLSGHGAMYVTKKYVIKKINEFVKEMTEEMNATSK